MVGLIVLLFGLSMLESDQNGHPRSEVDIETWCDAMLEKPHAEWIEMDFHFFSEHCLYNDL